MRQTHYPTNPEHDKLVKLSWPAVIRLLKLALPYKVHLAIGGTLMLFSSAVNLSLPLVARTALNRVIETKSASSLDRLAGLIFVLIAVSAALNFTQYLLIAFAGNRIVKDMREKLFSHLQRLPVRYFDQTRSGDLASHLSNDVGLIQTTLTSDIVGLVSNLVTLFGGIFLALYIDWKLTLVVVGMLACVMAGFVVFGRRLRRLTRQALDALSDAMGSMTEAMANIRLVKAFTRETYEDSRAATKLDTVFKLNMRTSVWEGAMGAVATVGFISLLLGVVWYGGRNVIAGTLSLGSLVAFFMTVTIISGPMGSLASLYTRLQRAVGAADRLFAILDETPEELDSPLALEFPDAAGSVKFTRLEFSYVPETPVLTGLNLELLPGKVTAIVGHSGSGKTTLASLLYRFYEPQNGEILIDGVPVRSVKRSALRHHIGIVPQDSILFAGTIRENMRYGRLDATDEEVEQAARDANVAEFVAGFPDGYETLIGERGVTLSGGQKQRVAIARVLLKSPRILVLDEATSALDSRSEALVQEALERLMRGRTTMVIAHRLSTIRTADQIAVLDDGRIIEIGTHDELISRGGRYAELYDQAAIS